MSLELDLKLQRMDSHIPITTGDLFSLAQACHERWPEGMVFKNRNGNLAVVIDGEDVGWLDLFRGALIDLSEDW